MCQEQASFCAANKNHYSCISAKVIRIRIRDCAPGENSLLWQWQDLAFWCRRLLRQLWNRVKLYEFARKITRAVAQHWAMQEGNFQFYVSINPVLGVTQENNEPGKIHLLGPDICFLLPSGLQISCLFRQILKQYNCKGCASSMIHPCQVSLGISLKSVPFLLIFSLWSYEAPCKLEFSISSAFPASTIAVSQILACISCPAVANEPIYDFHHLSHLASTTSLLAGETQVCNFGREISFRNSTSWPAWYLSLWPQATSATCESLKHLWY